MFDDLIDLSRQGWCTPTLIVTVLGLLSIVTLSVQTALEKDKKNYKKLLTAVLSKLIWTILIAGILFYLCSNGKIEAAWWIFGILYILPVAIMFVALAGSFYVQGNKDEDEE